MPATKRKSARSKAKTKKACEAAGGSFRSFKPKGKKAVAFCAPKKRTARKVKKAGKKAGRALKKGDIPAGLVKACKTAKKAGFKGKKKSLRAPCAVVLAA
jgi:hypothetical protein